MVSPAEPADSHSETQRMTVLLLAAVALNMVELFLPRIPIFPWLKPGLANIVTIVWIVRYGVLDALLLSLLRIWVVAFYFGFSFITLSLSASGAIASTAAMGLLWHGAGKRNAIGTVGIAVVGALFHNSAQLIVVYVLIARNAYLFYQGPAMLAASVVFGSLVGLIVPGFASAVDALQIRNTPATKPRAAVQSSRLGAVAGVLLLSGCMALAFAGNTTVLGTAAGAMTALVLIITRFSVGKALRPISRFWMMFLFVAFLHGLPRYGTRIPHVPWLTYEGAGQTLRQWLRLWTWLETGLVLAWLGFHEHAFEGLRRVFPGRKQALLAGLDAVELFPAVVDHVRGDSGTLVRLLVRRPAALVAELLARIQDIARKGEQTLGSD